MDVYGIFNAAQRQQTKQVAHGSVGQSPLIYNTQYNIYIYIYNYVSVWEQINCVWRIEQ